MRDDILDERLKDMLGTIDIDGSGEIEKEEFIKKFRPKDIRGLGITKDNWWESGLQTRES